MNDQFAEILLAASISLFSAKFVLRLVEFCCGQEILLVTTVCKVQVVVGTTTKVVVSVLHVS